MNAISALLRELIGLFVDDNSLAACIVMVVALAASLSFWAHAPSLVVGAVIGLGTLAALIFSTLRGH